MPNEHKCPECSKGCDCDWYNGFDAGFDGEDPELPGEMYLEGFNEGRLDREEFDAEDGQPWDDEEHPDSEYEPEEGGK